MTLERAFGCLAVAIVAGALIGAERQQAQAKESRDDFGGIRTFPLLALLGAIAGLLRPVTGPWLSAVLLLAAFALLTASYVRSNSEHLGVSSEIAALLTLGLGVVAATPELMADGPRYLLVTGVAAATMALLALKRPLHGFVARVSDEDVYATVKFVLLALVIIPLLPDETYGPLDVLNPSKIGLMIALVAGVSFAGYIAARWIGSERGILLVGVIGGLVSSTAVTLTLSGRAREDASIAPMAAAAILAACSTMFARILVVVGVADRALLSGLALPVGAAAVGGYAVSALLYRRERKRPAHAVVPLKNPFELRKAVGFGLLYAAVLFVSKAAETYVGNSGVFLSAFLGGTADVDAITLSLTELHRAGMPPEVATRAITLAALTNTLVKFGIAFFVGGPKLGRRVGVGLLVAVAAGGLALVLGSVLLG